MWVIYRDFTDYRVRVMEPVYGLVSDELENHVEDKVLDPVVLGVRAIGFMVGGQLEDSLP